MTLDEQTADTIPPPAPTLPAPPDKSCLCGATHDPFEWLQLPHVGVMADEVDTLTLRNCHCGSTLAVEGIR